MRLSRLLFPALAASALFVSACGGGGGGGSSSPPPTAPPTITPTLAPSPSISPSTSPSASPRVSPSSTPTPSASQVTLGWTGLWSSSLGPNSGSALNPVDFPGTGASDAVTVTPTELSFTGSFAASLGAPQGGGGCTSFTLSSPTSATTFTVTATAAGASCTLTVAGAAGTTSATLTLNAPATISGGAQ